MAIMLDRLHAFAGGDIPIGQLVNDLEGLLAQLELVDDKWQGDFIDAWGDLEIPWAVALDRQEPIPTFADSTVSEGVRRLEALIRSSLATLHVSDA